MKSLKTKKYVPFFIIVLLLVLLSPLMSYFNTAQIAYYKNENEGVKSSYIVPGGGSWLKNSNFDTTIAPWFPRISGDSSDVNTSYSPSQANLEIIGDHRIFEISGTPTEIDWHNVTNPLFPALPDNYGIDSNGCWANHTWIDPTDPNQSPSIHWERNVTMPVNMSDYVITSASISAVYNATVTAYPGGAFNPSENYGVETPGDQTGTPASDYQRDYDSVRFYVLISDLDDNEKYEIAWYQSIDLGKDSAGAYDNITDSFMNPVVQETLIFYLSSLFKRDNSHFKITLGIRIKCIDNWNYDRDRWDSLRIKSCNLNFTYEKKIDKFTTVSWNQIGNQINGDNVYITGANLTFKYKTDQPWPEVLSPNSEIRMLINNNSHTETINLNLATTTFQEAKPEGFDVGYLILKAVNISLSIQLYLADEFLFNETITISLDDIFLEITYFTVYPDIGLSEPEIFRLLLILALVAGTAVGTYFILYQRIFKFPLPVRRVRKYRKTLNKVEAPRSPIAESGTLFKKTYKKQLEKSSKYLKIESAKNKGGGSLK